MVGTVRPSIPVQTILKAVNGETEALDAVLRHYSSYIRVLSIRPVKDTYGNEFLCVDESMRNQQEGIKINLLKLRTLRNPNILIENSK